MNVLRGWLWVGLLIENCFLCVAVVPSIQAPAYVFYNDKVQQYQPTPYENAVPVNVYPQHYGKTYHNNSILTFKQRKTKQLWIELFCLQL